MTGGSKCTSLFTKQLAELAIPFLLQILLGDKPESSGIDAITQAPLFLRTVVEYMAQMGIRFAASDLGADHKMAEVRFFLHRMFGQRLRKAGPATAGIKFIQRAEQGFARHNIHIDALFLMVEKRIAEWRLRCVILGYLVLYRRQVAGIMGCTGPMPFNKRLPAGPDPVTLVMHRIFLVVVLVVLLRRIEWLGRLNGDHNRFIESSAFRKLALGLLGNLFLLIGMVKNRGAVGVTPVVELTARVGGSICCQNSSTSLA